MLPLMCLQQMPFRDSFHEGKTVVIEPYLPSAEVIMKAMMHLLSRYSTFYLPSTDVVL